MGNKLNGPSIHSSPRDKNGRELLPPGTTVEEGWKKKAADPKHTSDDDIPLPRFQGNTNGCSILCAYLSPLNDHHRIHEGKWEVFDQCIEREFGEKGDGFVIDSTVCPCLGDLRGTLKWDTRGAYPLADWTTDFRPGWKVSFDAQNIFDHHPHFQKNSPPH